MTSLVDEITCLLTGKSQQEKLREKSDRGKFEKSTRTEMEKFEDEIEILQGQHAPYYPYAYFLRIETVRLTIVIAVVGIEQVAEAAVCRIASDHCYSLAC